MTTTLTPPPLPPTPMGPTGPGGPGASGAGSTPAPPGGPRSSTRVVAILAIVLGVVIIIGSLASAAFSAIRTSTRGSAQLTADATGIRTLDVDISAGDLTIVYRGDEVALAVRGDTDAWRLDRDGDSVRVHTDRPWWNGWRVFDGEDSAVLTLPSALEHTALDAELKVAAGVLRTDATFDELAVRLSAGSVEVRGSARTVDAEVSAGRVVFDLAGADSADLRLSAGAITGSLTGAAPSTVAIDVSAGRLELTLPRDVYAVSTDVSAGTVDNGLRVDPTSRHRVTASVSAGAAVLRD
ncbi:hypothetical protein [Microbacterium dextranolyticum]|uniref:Adhesin domain-containing protein n=1 Tax=Microbacterium dextranolyticum TaxID=36806 RepID=A0A9W6M5Z2_9MICO|nr:hypothetical protein [Microbacterium dextranolyticum]MBM7464005.1 hypothetical protein [Microbacterium dextranolyticum]GLJ95085.1 hypothetical protein GCM10017591_11470 [Microbacterium dextranolyticum]